MKRLKVQLLDLTSKFFSNIDHVLVPSIPISKWESFIKSISPIDNGHNLTIIGDESDGSYLLPNDFQGISMNISPGVGETWHFEKNLLEVYGIPSILLDASVDEPKGLPKEIEFIREFLVPIDRKGFGVSINRLVSDMKNRFGENVELMLQMDIEGSEYECLYWAEESDLANFRILAIEFHDMELWIQNSHFVRRIEPIFQKLLKQFDVVHSNSNNHSHTFYYKGRFVPSALELTFHRKDRSMLTRTPSRKSPRFAPSSRLNTSTRTPFSSK